MDANTACGLVNTTDFTSYSQILTGDALVEFNVSSHVTLRTTTDTTNDFTSFITSANNFTGGKPRLNSNKPGIVTGYLSYPRTPYSEDYYTTSGTNQFRAASSFSNTVTTIISAGDLCSSNDIYSATVYNGTNHAALSLTVLYKTLSSNLTPEQSSAIKGQIDTLQNKNKMFYSFFVSEYCYYNKMYGTVLSNFFAEYTSTTRAPSFSASVASLKTSAGANCTTDTTAEAQAARLDALSLLLARINSRLIDMRSLLSAIQSYYSASLQQLQVTLNSATALGSDRNAELKVLSLKDQAAGVEQSKDASVYRQGIMEYTSEKNRYSNILLGIYAFLNIAIVAVIFSIKE